MKHYRRGTCQVSRPLLPAALKPAVRSERGRPSWIEKDMGDGRRAVHVPVSLALPTEEDRRLASSYSLFRLPQCRTRASFSHWSPNRSKFSTLAKLLKLSI